MQEHQEFKKNRFSLFEEMNTILDSWNGAPETGPEIISQMKTLLHEVQQLQELPLTLEEEQLLREIYKKETRIVAVMEVAKEEIAQELRGMNKNKAIVQNYVYPQKTPTFVNQEL